VVDGNAWTDPGILASVRKIVGPAARLVGDDSLDRFDILPLLVATGGGFDRTSLLETSPVLKSGEGDDIVRRFGGKVALNCGVEQGGEIRVSQEARIVRATHGEHAGK
jgi:hypothetical protein